MKIQNKLLQRQTKAGKETKSRRRKLVYLLLTKGKSSNPAVYLHVALAFSLSRQCLENSVGKITNEHGLILTEYQKLRNRAKSSLNKLHSFNLRLCHRGKYSKPQKRKMRVVHVYLTAVARFTRISSISID